ncbi:MAG: TlpA disulfide reductase family protein [bacterium]
MRNVVKVIIIAAVLAFFTVSILAMSGTPSKEPAKRQLAYDFSLPNLNGKQVKLSSFRGKIVLLNFWASWCPPCREEMPSIENLFKKMKGKDFKILAVSLDEGGADVVKKFIAKNRYTFPVLLDPDNNAAGKYGIYSIPTTYIIDKQGYIIDYYIGGRDWAEDAAIKEFKKLL